MLGAELATLIESTGVLDATHLTLVFGGAEILLISIDGVLPERCNQAYECSDNGQDVFHNTAHSAPTA
jgi:hypothetical protein